MTILLNISNYPKSKTYGIIKNVPEVENVKAGTYCLEVDGKFDKVYIRKITFKSINIFSDMLVAVKTAETSIFRDAPIFVGL